MQRHGCSREAPQPVAGPLQAFDPKTLVLFGFKAFFASTEKDIAARNGAPQRLDFAPQCLSSPVPTKIGGVRLAFAVSPHDGAPVAFGAGALPVSLPLAPRAGPLPAIVLVPLAR